uniref:Uncharacterized protein n=1 Tax=Aegilops tauschii subsp. strangulata TaxID=200361 RepID=A0A453FGQ8_AEGTS
EHSVNRISVDPCLPNNSNQDSVIRIDVYSYSSCSFALLFRVTLSAHYIVIC